MANENQKSRPDEKANATERTLAAAAYVLVKNNHRQVRVVGRQKGQRPELLERGWNRLEAALWADLKKEAGLAPELKAPMGRTPSLVEQAFPEGDTAGDLRGIEPADAVAIVADTFDAKLLATWLGTENRGAVIKALNERQAEVASGEAHRRADAFGGGFRAA